MKKTTFSPILWSAILLLFVTGPVTAGSPSFKNQKCKHLGYAFSKGHGNNKTKGRGGKSLRIPIAKIKRFYESSMGYYNPKINKRVYAKDAYLKITKISGSIRKVALYARHINGSWKKIYKGGVLVRHRTFGLIKFKPYWSNRKITDIIVSVNGEDERYLAVKGKAKVQLCVCDPMKKKKTTTVSKKYIESFYGKYGRGWDPNSTSGGGNCNDGKSGRIKWSKEKRAPVAKGLYLGESRISFKDPFTIVAVDWNWIGKISSNRHTIVWYEKGKIVLIWKKGCG